MFLEELITNDMKKNASIITFLRARGFFIDETDGHYFLSDNATVGDYEYLKKGLNEYQLGTIKKTGEFGRSSRRVWNLDFLEKSYTYETINHEQIEIKIDDNATIDNVYAFFDEMGQNRSPEIWEKRTWREYVIEKLPCKPNVCQLEGYVSFYVKAISSCGVYTYTACDGNHINGGAVYVGAKYPWNIWHEYIWKYIVQKNFGDITYISHGIKFFNEKSQQEIYMKLYHIANFLYENRRRIREIKAETLKNITERILSYHDDEIEHFYRCECEKILRSIEI